jgi:ABC-2 type transport system ATP-binding protein
MTEVIEAFGLTKAYGRRRGIVDLTFSVHEGEVFGFLGPNGAGKTTTIRSLLGLLRPTSGRAALFGLDAWHEAPAVHERISFVGSEPGYLGELTAAEQLDYLARLRRLPRNAWRPVAERFELDPTVAIKRLSRGNRQKVGVVQAFMGDAPLLILDEPTTGLDPLMQREFLAAVAEVRADGRTVFLSSHNLPEVERSCDRVGIIRDGRLAEISTVQALQAGHWRSVNLVLAQSVAPDAFDLPNVQVASITARDIHLMVRGDVNPLLRRISELDVRDVSITTPEIEDVFLRLYSTNGQPEADVPEVVR